jgi:hypothetical protein
MRGEYAMVGSCASTERRAVLNCRQRPTTMYTPMTDRYPWHKQSHRDRHARKVTRRYKRCQQQGGNSVGSQGRVGRRGVSP